MEELVDAAEDAVGQLQKQHDFVKRWLEEYGYVGLGLDRFGVRESDRRVNPRPFPFKAPPQPSQTNAPTEDEPVLPSSPRQTSSVTATTPPRRPYDLIEAPNVDSPQAPTSFALPLNAKSKRSYLSLQTPITSSTGVGGMAGNPTNPYDSEPDSPTLEDFGVSNYSLGLIGDTFTGPANGASPVIQTISDTNSPVPPSFRYSVSSRASSNRRPSDPNSMFKGLLASVEEDEYATLPEYLRTQFSLKLLNEMVSEINEHLTDKRFMADDDSEEDQVTLDDKMMGVVTALLQLQRAAAVPGTPSGGEKRYQLIC
ncbi:hypothetical protein HDV00_010026 [Rhizophlyctis rosea]|nr:hypothetical protein HDV00_010026 [Rhizophlyctis rosea]